MRDTIPARPCDLAGDGGRSGRFSKGALLEGRRRRCGPGRDTRQSARGPKAAPGRSGAGLGTRVGEGRGGVDSADRHPRPASSLTPRETARPGPRSPFSPFAPCGALSGGCANLALHASGGGGSAPRPPGERSGCPKSRRAPPRAAGLACSAACFILFFRPHPSTVLFLEDEEKASALQLRKGDGWSPGSGKGARTRGRSFCYSIPLPTPSIFSYVRLPQCSAMY